MTVAETDPLQQAALLMRQGKPAEARIVYRAILDRHPHLFAGWYGYGALAASLGLLSEARESFEHALRLQPDDPGVLRQLAHVLHESGSHEEAAASLERALAHRPDTAHGRSSLLLFQQYRPGLTPQQLLDAARRWSDWAIQRAGGPRPRPPRRVLDGPLRVGYVSGDLGIHPVGMFLAPVLRRHDPAAVIPFVYDAAPKQDALAKLLRKAALKAGGEWRDIGSMEDAAAAALIASDGIDLLVDLSGHTARGRSALFAWRAAPVQLAWLGYFATTGLSVMDFVISDRFHSPPGSEADFSETLLRMPHNRFCFQPLTDPPPRQGSPFIRNGYVTFGCFNNPAKLNEDVLAAWAGILRRVPESRLLLKWKSFADAPFRAHISGILQRHGIAQERVECRPDSAYQTLLRQYGEVDIALDPFPFSGGQSSVEALWMGTPLVTLAGERMVSRQGCSFLSVIGLPELVAGDVEAYGETAVALARDGERLAELHRSLRERMRQSPLCDAPRFTRDLETLYRQAYAMAGEDGR